MTLTQRYERPWHVEPTWKMGDEEVTLVFASNLRPEMVFEVPRELTGLARYVVEQVNGMGDDEYRQMMESVTGPTRP